MTNAAHATLFAGLDLAARVERVERTLIEESARAGQTRDPAQTAVLLPVGSGCAVWASDGSPFNKVVGVGIDSTITDDELDQVERTLAERGAEVQFEVATLAQPEVAQRLTRRGYVLVGFENVLGLALTPELTEQRSSVIDVRTVGPEDFETWLTVDVEGSATPDGHGIAAHEEFSTDAVERAQRDLAATSGFVCSLASIDGVPVGSGSMRLSEGVAQLCGAATLPAFRRRGVQASLLAARLAIAAGAGCDLAVVTVQPGSTSQRNVQKHGFQLLYARSILVRSFDGRFGM